MLQGVLHMFKNGWLDPHHWKDLEGGTAFYCPGGASPMFQKSHGCNHRSPVFGRSPPRHRLSPAVIVRPVSVLSRLLLSSTIA